MKLYRKMKKIVGWFIMMLSIWVANAQDSTIVQSHYLTIPKTDIEIIPPKFFIVLPSTPNVLVHPTTSSTIQVNEIKGLGYPLSIKKLTKKHIEEQGATFIFKKDTITANGNRGTLYLVRFKVKGHDSNHTELEYERYMFFTGNYENTIWINANYPVIAKETIAPVLLHSVLSARFVKQ